jgi:hypothetical protein
MNIGERASTFLATNLRSFRHIFSMLLFPSQIKKAKIATVTAILASLFLVYISPSANAEQSTILGTTGANPIGITIDSSGNIYTANAGANNVSKITPLGVSTILSTTGTQPQWNHNRLIWKYLYSKRSRKQCQQDYPTRCINYPRHYGCSTLGNHNRLIWKYLHSKRWRKQCQQDYPGGCINNPPRYYGY